MRIYYLLGNLKAADEVLKELDPLKLLNSNPNDDCALWVTTEYPKKDGSI